MRYPRAVSHAFLISDVAEPDAGRAADWASAGVAASTVTRIERRSMASPRSGMADERRRTPRMATRDSNIGCASCQSPALSATLRMPKHTLLALSCLLAASTAVAQRPLKVYISADMEGITGV